MRNENEVWYNTFVIVSEPGDRTRYEYMVYRDGPDEFCFMPMKSTIRFPQRLNYYSVDNLPKNATELNEEDTPGRIAITELAKEEDCNVYTLMECIRTVKILHTRKMK